MNSTPASPLQCYLFRVRWVGSIEPICLSIIIIIFCLSQVHRLHEHVQRHIDLTDNRLFEIMKN